jgi:hypothetical protein
MDSPPATEHFKVVAANAVSRIEKRTVSFRPSEYPSLDICTTSNPSVCQTLASKMELPFIRIRLWENPSEPKKSYINMFFHCLFKDFLGPGKDGCENIVVIHALIGYVEHRCPYAVDTQNEPNHNQL